MKKFKILLINIVYARHMYKYINNKIATQDIISRFLIKNKKFCSCKINIFINLPFDTHDNFRKLFHKIK